MEDWLFASPKTLQRHLMHTPREGFRTVLEQPQFMFSQVDVINC